MKIWNNYKVILDKANEYPQFQEEVKEIRYWIVQWFNVKTSVMTLKKAVEEILNNEIK